MASDFPTSEVEAAGAALAKTLAADPAAALEQLLGPELPGGEARATYPARHGSRPALNMWAAGSDHGCLPCGPQALCRASR
jgi:hypothetical protein